MSGQSSTPETIFAQAIGIAEADARAAFLDRACGNDLALRGEVERLVSDHFRAGSFLESPPPGLTAAIDVSEIREKPGTTVGPYKLLEQIGEGGMGVVFMAEQQEPVRRKVAIKLIKPGMDTRQVIARFEAERQALAVMDHPNIARVLDAGATPSGHPYFVMELVRGVPITTYCDENKLPVLERLDLFTSVCQAIQHAHTKGIIHRDIKPSNVLVTRQDGRPVVKVIDFGVAKAVGQQLTEKTLFTNFAQMIGTPLYMSPEQAEQSGVDIDTRSDIYSLGVLLYELLTGSTPVDAEQLKQAAFEEIRRIIREDEPQTPSARISGSHTLPAIAAQRHIEPSRLSRLLRGELDWIVMKALEKDRNRRYETANAFAADVMHYLHDEPVLASPPSAAYRFRKFFRRNRVALTSAALVVTALVVGTAVSSWQAILAERARAGEAAQRKVAEKERAESEKQRAAAEANFKRARDAVDQYFTLISESTLLNVPGLQPLRKELLEAALQFYRSSAVERTDDPTVLADLATTYIRLAVINQAIDRNDEAVTFVNKALTVVDRLRREFPKARDQRRRLAGFWNGFRPMQRGTELPKDSQGAFQTIVQLLAAWQSLANEFPTDVAFRSDLAALSYLTGDLLASGGQPTRGVVYFTKSKEILQPLVHEAPNNPEYRADLARTHEQLARNLPRAGRAEDAEAESRAAMVLREQLVSEFPKSPQYRQDLALSLRQIIPYVQARDTAEAEKLANRCVELSQSLVDEYPNVALYRSDLVASKKMSLVAEVATGRPEAVDDAAAELDELIVNCPTDPNSRHDVALLARQVATAIPDDPRFRSQESALFRRSLEMFQDLSREQPKVAHHREDIGHSARLLGWCMLRDGDLEESCKCFQVGADAFETLAASEINQRDGFYQEFHASTLLQLLNVRRSQGQEDEAKKIADQVLKICRRLVDEYPRNLKYRWEWLHALASEERWAEASELLPGILELAPDDMDGEYCVALVRLKLNDREGYRQACTAMLNRFAKAKKPVANHRFVWACSLAPDALDELSVPLAHARYLVEQEPDSPQHACTLGALLFRCGQFEDAISPLEASAASLEEKSDTRLTVTYPRLFLAMTHWRLGQPAKARQWLAEARSSSQPDLLHRLSWARRAIVGLLLAEAEQLIPDTD